MHSFLYLPFPFPCYKFYVTAISSFSIKPFIFNVAYIQLSLQKYFKTYILLIISKKGNFRHSLKTSGPEGIKKRRIEFPLGCFHLHYNLISPYTLEFEWNSGTSNTMGISSIMGDWLEMMIHWRNDDKIARIGREICGYMTIRWDESTYDITRKDVYLHETEKGRGQKDFRIIWCKLLKLNH